MIIKYVQEIELPDEQATKATIADAMEELARRIKRDALEGILDQDMLMREPGKVTWKAAPRLKKRKDS